MTLGIPDDIDADSSHQRRSSTPISIPNRATNARVGENSLENDDCSTLHLQPEFDNSRLIADEEEEPINGVKNETNFKDGFSYTNSLNHLRQLDVLSQSFPSNNIPHSAQVYSNHNNSNKNNEGNEGINYPFSADISLLPNDYVDNVHNVNNRILQSIKYVDPLSHEFGSSSLPNEFPNNIPAEHLRTPPKSKNYNSNSISNSGGAIRSGKSYNTQYGTRNPHLKYSQNSFSDLKSSLDSLEDINNIKKDSSSPSKKSLISNQYHLKNLSASMSMPNIKDVINNNDTYRHSVALPVNGHTHSLLSQSLELEGNDSNFNKNEDSNIAISSSFQSHALNNDLIDDSNFVGESQEQSAAISSAINAASYYAEVIENQEDDMQETSTLLNGNNNKSTLNNSIQVNRLLQQFGGATLNNSTTNTVLDDVNYRNHQIPNTNRSIPYSKRIPNLFIKYQNHLLNKQQHGHSTNIYEQHHHIKKVLGENSLMSLKEPTVHKDTKETDHMKKSSIDFNINLEEIESNSNKQGIIKSQLSPMEEYDITYEDNAAPKSIEELIQKGDMDYDLFVEGLRLKRKQSHSVSDDKPVDNDICKDDNIDDILDNFTIRDRSVRFAD